MKFNTEGKVEITIKVNGKNTSIFIEKLNELYEFLNKKKPNITFQSERDVPYDFNGCCFLLDNNSILYLKNRKYHRVDGPAIEYANGRKEWWLNGNRHRLDGPAIDYGDNIGDRKEWYVNGLLHRVDGPAIEIKGSVSNSWHFKGKYYPNFTAETWKKFMETIDYNAVITTETKSYHPNEFLGDPPWECY